MAMEISGQNYSGYAVQGMAGNSAANSTKRKETGKTQETAGSGKLKSTTEYANELAKLVPSVEFKVGSGFSSAKSGKTLTISPELLKKMQNDPEQEKETKELIKGVESAMKMIENFNRGTGWTVVFKHSYIDENGKYHSVAYYRNDFMLNLSDKLREERRENSEKLMEKTKEKAVEKKAELEKTLEERRAEKAEKAPGESTGEETAEKAEKESAYSRAEQLFNEKMAASKDGTIYLNDTDLRIMIEAAQENSAGKAGAKEQTQVGANLDLQV